MTKNDKNEMMDGVLLTENQDGETFAEELKRFEETFISINCKE